MPFRIEIKEGKSDMSLSKAKLQRIINQSNVMENFNTAKCPYAKRSNIGMITCSETGTLCYGQNCSYKDEYKVSKELISTRAKACNYKCLLTQTKEERKHNGKTFLTLLDENPEFLLKQLARLNTFGDFKDYLNVLALDIVNATIKKKLEG